MNNTDRFIIIVVIALTAVTIALIVNFASKITNREEEFREYYNDYSDFAGECQGVHGYLVFNPCALEMKKKIDELEDRIEALEQ